LGGQLGRASGAHSYRTRIVNLPWRERHVRAEPRGRRPGAANYHDAVTIPSRSIDKLAHVCPEKWPSQLGPTAHSPLPRSWFGFQKNRDSRTAHPHHGKVWDDRVAVGWQPAFGVLQDREYLDLTNFEFSVTAPNDSESTFGRLAVRRRSRAHFVASAFAFPIESIWNSAR